MLTSPLSHTEDLVLCGGATVQSLLPKTAGPWQESMPPAGCQVDLRLLRPGALCAVHAVPGACGTAGRA